MSNTFAGLTEAQHRVFEQIATGNDGGHNQNTIKALMRRNLIECEVISDQPMYLIRRYFVPLPVHIRWCMWCAEQPDEGDETPTP